MQELAVEIVSPDEWRVELQDGAAAVRDEQRGEVGFPAIRFGRGRAPFGEVRDPLAEVKAAREGGVHLVLDQPIHSVVEGIRRELLPRLGARDCESGTHSVPRSFKLGFPWKS